MCILKILLSEQYLHFGKCLFFSASNEGHTLYIAIHRLRRNLLGWSSGIPRGASLYERMYVLVIMDHYFEKR